MLICTGAAMDEVRADILQMKNNDLFIEGVLNYNGQQYVYFNNSFNIEYIPQAVEYFTKYVDAYKSHGVTINGITLENEPLNYQGTYCLAR